MRYVPYEPPFDEYISSIILAIPIKGLSSFPISTAFMAMELLQETWICDLLTLECLVYEQK